MNNRSCPEDVLLRDARWPPRRHRRVESLREKSLTVLVCPPRLGRAAGAVPRRGETQHRGVILCELLQTRHISHMDAVLEVRSRRYHGNIVVSARLPGQQLKTDEWKKGGNRERERESEELFHCNNSHTKLTTMRLPGSREPVWRDIRHRSTPQIYLERHPEEVFDWEGIAPLRQTGRGRKRQDSIPWCMWIAHHIASTNGTWIDQRGA